MFYNPQLFCFEFIKSNNGTFLTAVLLKFSKQVTEWQVMCHIIGFRLFEDTDRSCREVVMDGATIIRTPDDFLLAYSR